MKFEPTFGILIAFLLPGFLCLYGLSLSVPALKVFVPDSASAADFFYTALASLSLGLIISATRWAVLDTCFRFVKLSWPAGTNWDKLSDEKALASFQFVVQNHYHYYQYYSNTFVAILVAAVAYEAGPGSIGWLSWLGVILILLILLIGSYDTLSRYFERGGAVLGIKKGT
jgi:hypothetical protein